MRRIFPLFISLFLIWSGCKNDINLLDNYKNEILTYGLLDPADTAHYIRISRVFLGPGNALTFSQNPDSIGFPVGTVDAKIQQWKNGILLQTFQLYPDTVIPRDSGIFQWPHQVLYRGVFPVLTDGSTYKLFVLDLRRGNSLTAETPIVQDPVLVNPVSNFMPLNLWNNTNFDIQSRSGAFGKRYDFRIRFHYTEQFIYDTTQTSEHFVDWNLGELDASTNQGNFLMTTTVRRSHFLVFCGEKITNNNYVRRIAGKIDFIFVGAAQEFANYLDTENNTAYVDIPPFSNVTGGYGLFSSRTTTSFSNYVLDSDTKDALRTSNDTQGLNFIR